MSPNFQVVAAATLLLVSSGARAAESGTAEAMPAAPAAAPDPQRAAEQVKIALRDAQGVPPSLVVSTHAETIVLTGDVDSELEASRALRVAERAAGGVRVSSQLEVRPAEAVAGAARQVTSMVQEVEKALRADPRTANLGVSVSIDDAQVIGLHGLVPSAENRRAAEEVAGRVQGVRRVHSHLVVPGE